MELCKITHPRTVKQQDRWLDSDTRASHSKVLADVIEPSSWVRRHAASGAQTADTQAT